MTHSHLTPELRTHLYNLNELVPTSLLGKKLGISGPTVNRLIAEQPCHPAIVASVSVLLADLKIEQWDYRRSDWGLTQLEPEVIDQIRHLKTRVGMTRASKMLKITSNTLESILSNYRTRQTTAKKVKENLIKIGPIGDLPLLKLGRPKLYVDDSWQYETPHEKWLSDPEGNHPYQVYRRTAEPFSFLDHSSFLMAQRLGHDLSQPSDTPLKERELAAYAALKAQPNETYAYHVLFKSLPDNDPVFLKGSGSRNER